ncbi:MAG TPA: hypothetical protein VHO70_19620 [Chitinispirillaceae bacterium]|nr:hypothetical protein [Chitinispirillaceae bacterium]
MSAKESHYIVGIHITDRLQNVPAFQTLLSEYGCCIKTRLGLHDVSDNYCSQNGLVLIELVGDDAKRDEFVISLRKINGIDVQVMVFKH